MKKNSEGNSTDAHKSKQYSVRITVNCLLATLMMLYSIVVTISTFLIRRFFGGLKVVAIVFTLKYSQGFSKEILWIIGLAAVLAALLCILYFVILRRLIRSSQERRENPSLRKRPHLAAIFTWILAISATVYFVKGIGVDEYLRFHSENATLYEDYYVSPDTVKLTFPAQKRNLIYISLESIESTYSSYENGGDNETDFLPELSALANENINFSNTEKLGGQSVFFPHITYTMGSVVAQTAGIALETPIFESIADKKKRGFLPGVTRLEDILAAQGYRQLIIQGSDADFAGYSTYAGRCENSSIYDYNAAKKAGDISANYYENWGIEDKTLLALSKKKILELAAQPEPFCVTLFTMDTHGFEGGYHCELCDASISDSYEAAVRCTSLQVADLIDWIKQQDFYENTVIILNGDHLSAVSPNKHSIVKKDDGYVRTDYNCIINAAKEPIQEKNRVFCTLDWFPTTLSALGVEIEGGRLGLGTDLFSEMPTLCEDIGAEAFAELIQRPSEYYDTHFFKDKREN